MKNKVSIEIEDRHLKKDKFSLDLLAIKRRHFTLDKTASVTQCTTRYEKQSEY